MNDVKNPKTLNELGDKYFHGIDTSVNIELAYTYYKQAADQGNPVGLYNVGKYFLEKKDYRKAIDFLYKALMSGYSKAHLLLAEMALSGKGMHKSKKKAFKYTFNAAKQGDLDAYNRLAKCYLEGIGCKKDEKKGWEYYQRSADKGSVEGMVQLGKLHLASPKGKKNPEKAIEWLDQAASNQAPEAIRTLMKLYSDPHVYLRKRSQAFLREMVFYYQELLARTGDVPALEKVSLDLYEGTDITKRNVEKSAEYFQLLVSMDNTIGHYGIGVSYLYGHGVQANPYQAKTHLEIAASRDYHQAMSRLGDMYRLGIGIEPDPESAKKWFYEAAKKNDPEALLNLGLLHYRKEITGASFELAFQYVENAAKKGYLPAYYWLGIFYDKGVGTTINYSLAEKAFQKAIAGNVNGALYKYALMQYEHAQVEKNRQKANKAYQNATRLFFTYIKLPNVAKGNAAYSAYYLGCIHKLGLGTSVSLRIARYWFEKSASFGLGKAMTEMYRLTKEKEFALAKKWLERAIKEANDPEGYYEMGMLYLHGYQDEKANVSQAKSYLEKSAELKYKPAYDQLMML